MKYHIHNRGFSMTELIVVIAIIAILSAVLYAGYGAIKERSTAAAFVAQLVEIETAMKLYRQYELPNGWPRVISNSGDVNDIAAGTNASFPNFDAYISDVPQIPVKNIVVGYNFPAGGPNYTCDTSVSNYESSGVNIHIEGLSVSMLNLMNDMIDGDNPTTGCGKFRISGSGNGFYNIASSTFSY